MRIQPIVEGQGDVAAVPILLRRLLEVADVWDLHIASPIRQSRNTLATRAGFRKALSLSRKLSGRSPVIVVMDSDDDCPAELGPELVRWAKADATDLTCVVVLAHREYEAWLLAGIESLRQVTDVRSDVATHPAPESPRDAKQALTQRMATRYLPTVHQARFTSQFDLRQAFRRSRSFRKLTLSIGVVLRIMDRTPTEWPPASWTEKSAAS